MAEANFPRPSTDSVRPVGTHSRFVLVLLLIGAVTALCLALMALQSVPLSMDEAQIEFGHVISRWGIFLSRRYSPG